jgi:hypothetical protein
VSNPLLLVKKATLWKAATAAGVLLMTATPQLQARSRKESRVLSDTGVWQHVSVKIVARGPHVSGSTGDMDSYLAVISTRKHEEIAARLVHYHPDFERAISDERLVSGAVFHFRVTAAEYCAMNATDFFALRIFDEESVAKMRAPGQQERLPCLLIRN